MSKQKKRAKFLACIVRLFRLNSTSQKVKMEDIFGREQNEGGKWWWWWWRSFFGREKREEACETERETTSGSCTRFTVIQQTVCLTTLFQCILQPPFNTHTLIQSYRQSKRERENLAFFSRLSSLAPPLLAPSIFLFPSFYLSLSHFPSTTATIQQLYYLLYYLLFMGNAM